MNKIIEATIRHDLDEIFLSPRLPANVPIEMGATAQEKVDEINEPFDIISPQFRTEVRNHPNPHRQKAKEHGRSDDYKPLNDHQP